MQTPPIPLDEAARLATLHSLEILDTPHEERFDRVTRIAQRLFDVPISLVSLVDETRQWFKSCQGLDASETHRDISFCGHAILGDSVFVIEDATLDARFADNPLVVGQPYIRFYAGFPLKAPDGRKMGTLCIIDRKPREFSHDDTQSLRDLGRMVEQELATLHLATMDTLTRISNRRGFQTLGLQALESCRRLHRPATLLFFDLDRFKQINDRYGHAEGDAALEQFAAILKDTFRDSDVVGRISGDEFAVLFTDSGGEDVEHALQRLQSAVERHNRASQRDYTVSYSVGRADFGPAGDATIDGLMELADHAMYENKLRRRASGNRDAAAR